MSKNGATDRWKGAFFSYRITPEGVDGSGPLYERVAQVAEPWLRERGIIE